MNNITFSEAQRTDLPRLLEIEQACFIFPWSKPQLTFALQRETVWVLRKARCTIGFIILQFVADQGEILNFAIHPDFQGQGFGKRLLQAALQKIRQKKCQRIFLEVRKSAIKVQQLYRQCGFVAIGIRKAYYPLPKGKREDAMMMAIEFNSEEKSASSFFGS